MSFKVILQPKAQRDVDHILAWLCERSPSGAAAWNRRWREVLERLQESADGCGLAPEDEDHGETIRNVIFKTRRGLPYRALFVIRDDRVHVIHVRGPGQDLVKPDDIGLPD